MRSAVGTWVVTMGKDRSPATHYLSGWSTKAQAQRSARNYRENRNYHRPVGVVQITPENCRKLIAREGWCPNEVSNGEGAGEV